MKKSIKHLPKRTQEELNFLLELIEQHIPWCCMVVLYGSYARGGYVLWDERIEFGIHTTFQSDLDIMVVVPGYSNIAHTERLLYSTIEDKYEERFEHRRHAPTQFIVEHISNLNKRLKGAQYFYTEIVKDCIMLYDSKEHELVKPGMLSYEEIKAIAMKEFDKVYPMANEFLGYGYTALDKNQYVSGSFLLHQACERYYQTISLVFTLNRPKLHDLLRLRARTRGVRELDAIFPQYRPNREPETFEQQCYDLLWRAYIESRYNPQFVVTKEQYEQMLKWMEEMKVITEKICKERIEAYDLLIAK